MARKGLIMWLSPSPESTEPWFSKELCSFLALENPKPFEITQVHHQKWRKKEEKYLNIHVHIKTWIACKKLPWNLRYMKKSLIRTVPMSNYNYFFFKWEKVVPLFHLFLLCFGRWWGGEDQTRQEFWWKLLIQFGVFLYCFSHHIFFFFFTYLHTEFPIKLPSSQKNACLIDTKSSKCITMTGSNYY